MKVSIDWIIRKKVIDALNEKTDQILHIVDGKLVCELRRKGMALSPVRAVTRERMTAR